MNGYMVACDRCEHHWHENDPEVTYLNGDGIWVCTDEAMCFERLAKVRAEFEEWARDTASALRDLETRL